MKFRMKFRIGDRVELINDHPDKSEILMSGWTGTVVNITTTTPPIGVRWDYGNQEYARRSGYERLHSCHGHCENGYGWYVYEQDICALEDIVSQDFNVADDDIFTMIGGHV